MTATVDLVTLGKWTLGAWRWKARRCWLYRPFWGLLPSRRTYWQGKLIYWSWFGFDLVHDRRGTVCDILGDWMGCSADEVDRRYRAHEAREKGGGPQ